MNRTLTYVMVVTNKEGKKFVRIGASKNPESRIGSVMRTTLRGYRLGPTLIIDRALEGPIIEQQIESGCCLNKNHSQIDDRTGYSVGRQTAKVILNQVKTIITAWTGPLPTGSFRWKSARMDKIGTITYE